MCNLRKAKLVDKVSALELYRYSIFFRNYIENVAEDCLKNGLVLESTGRNVSEAELSRLKVQLKNALLNCIISFRFHGIGYVLVKTKDTLLDLEEPVNIELPIGFEYLDHESVRDLGVDFDHITYKVKANNNGNSLDAVKIHKSRLIIYENFDYILKRYVPCYTESFLLDIYLFEKIYVEIEKRIENHNFLFYKDESLVQLQDALSSATTSLSALTQGSSDKGSGILSGFLRKQNSSNHSKDIFDKNDDIHFDKHHFYILGVISPKTLNLISDTVKIKANSRIEIANQTTSLKEILDSIISAINGITIIGDSVIDEASLRIATSRISANINSLFK